MSNDEFGAPASAEGIKWEDLKGALLLVKPKAFEAAINTVHGASPAIAGDVIVLDGELADTVFGDTLIFPKVLISQVKPRIGGMVLGRLGQGQKKPGQSAPWVLSEAVDADKVIARAYIAKTTEAPF